MLDCNKQASSSSGRERNYRRRRPKESPKSRGSRGDRCNPSQRISQINFLISSFKMEQDIVTNQQTKVSKVTTSAPSRATDWSHPIIGIRRTRQSSPYSSSLAASSPVEWKFGRLDKDGSYRLSSEEFLPLVDLSREKMKSLIGCANSLLLYCDTNKDSSVDSGEFSYCFNTANAVQLQNLLKNARMKNPRKDTKFQQVRTATALTLLTFIITVISTTTPPASATADDDTGQTAQLSIGNGTTTTTTTTTNIGDNSADALHSVPLIIFANIVLLHSLAKSRQLAAAKGQLDSVSPGLQRHPRQPNGDGGTERHWPTATAPANGHLHSEVHRRRLLRTGAVHA